MALGSLDAIAKVVIQHRSVVDIEATTPIDARRWRWKRRSHILAELQRALIEPRRFLAKESNHAVVTVKLLGGAGAVGGGGGGGGGGGFTGTTPLASLDMTLSPPAEIAVTT